jgi:hypothetical protein
MSEMLHWLICLKREICVKGKKGKCKLRKETKGDVGNVFILLIMAQYQLEINVHS